MEAPAIYGVAGEFGPKALTKATLYYKIRTHQKTTAPEGHPNLNFFIKKPRKSFLLVIKMN
ncbi:hypothetical protein ACVGWK_00300 [Enterobacter sichuanensis]